MNGKLRWEKKNTTSTMGSGPGKRWGHTCNAIKGGELLYVFGGYGQHNCQTNQVHVFDTESQTWSEPPVKGVPPIPRDSHTCTEVGDNLFVFGGTDGLNPLNDLHVLDTTSHTWFSPSVRGRGPEAREGHSAALVGKRLFIFGGCGKSKNNSEVYYNDLYILDTENFDWQRAVTSGTPPAARDSHSCLSWRNKIVIIGGEDQHDYYLSDVHILDTDTFVWKELHTSGQMLPPRAGHSSVAFGKYVFVFGGFTDAQNLYEDLYALDLDTGVWTKLLPIGEGPSARFSMSGDCLDPSKSGVLVFIGGCNKNLEALDDMYYLHTELIRDEGREERRLEKLSLRKQLKLKCQEHNVQHSEQSQQQQYFPLNMYRPTVGKRAFQATVTKNFANGYTIETIIDGKPLRGILFSNSKPNPNPYRKDAGSVEPKLTRDEDPVTRISTSHGSLTEDTSSASMKDTLHPKADQSLKVVIRDSHNLIGSGSNSETNKTFVTGASAMDYQTNLENPPVAQGSTVLPTSENPLDIAQGLDVFPTSENRPATVEGLEALPTIENPLAIVQGSENPPAVSQGSSAFPTSENSPAISRGLNVLPTSQNPPAIAQGLDDLPTSENPPNIAQGSDALPMSENPPGIAKGSDALPTSENPPDIAQGSDDLPTSKNPSAIAQGSDALPTSENPPAIAWELDGLHTNPPTIVQGPGALPTLENPPAMVQVSSVMSPVENLPTMAQGSESCPTVENQRLGALPVLENSPATVQGSDAIPILEDPPATAQGSGSLPTDQDEQVTAADKA